MGCKMSRQVPIKPTDPIAPIKPTDPGTRPMYDFHVKTEVTLARYPKEDRKIDKRGQKER
jgi:hypothetical protein